MTGLSMDKLEISWDTADLILIDNLRVHIALLREWNAGKDEKIQQGETLEGFEQEDYMNNLQAIAHMEYVVEYFGGNIR